MDIVSLAAIVLATVSVIGGSILKGAGVKALLSSAAFMIVVLGTIASVCLHTPASTLKRAMAIAKWVFMPPKSDPHQTIEQIVEWSNTARKQGLLALEASVDAQPDEFIKKGLQMLVDGAEPETLRATLEVEIGAKEHHDLAAAKVFVSVGIYAPLMPSGDGADPPFVFVSSSTTETSKIVGSLKDHREIFSIAYERPSRTPPPRHSGLRNASPSKPTCATTFSMSPPSRVGSSITRYRALPLGAPGSSAG